MAIDALSEFIFIGNLQKAAVIFQLSKRPILAIVDSETYGLTFLYGVYYCLDPSVHLPISLMQVVGYEPYFTESRQTLRR